MNAIVTGITRVSNYPISRKSPHPLVSFKTKLSCSAFKIVVNSEYFEFDNLTLRISLTSSMAAVPEHAGCATLAGTLLLGFLMTRRRAGPLDAGGKPGPSLGRHPFSFEADGPALGWPGWPPIFSKPAFRQVRLFRRQSWKLAPSTPKTGVLEYLACLLTRQAGEHEPAPAHASASASAPAGAEAHNHSKMVAKSPAGSTGFPRCAFIPASRQRRRSSSNTSAVRAMIGVSRYPGKPRISRDA